MASITSLLQQVDEILIDLLPKDIELSYAKRHNDSLKNILRTIFGAESFKISASLNKTLLPHEAIEITQLLPKKQSDKWCSQVTKTLCQDSILDAPSSAEVNPIIDDYMKPRSSMSYGSHIPHSKAVSSLF